MIRKFTAFSVTILLVAIAAAQQKPFTISGTIRGKTNGVVYISYGSQGENYTEDSSLIRNGHFSFKGDLDAPVQALVWMNPNSTSYKYVQLYLSAGNMRLLLDYNKFSSRAVLQGSRLQEEANVLQKVKASVIEKMEPFNEAYTKANRIYIEAIKAKKDEATLQQLNDEVEKIKDDMEPYQEQLKKIDRSFMDKYPGSYITACLIILRMMDMPLEEAQERYNKFPGEIRNRALGKIIKNEIDALKLGSPGAKAYVFSSKELSGEQLSLADYEGKYVLLDFWASWCVPCRKSNPHLKELYSKYKDKGLEIIGISDDDNNHDAWQKAVEKDQIGVWKQVLRGFDMQKMMKGEKNSNDISQYYGIHTLPTKILIDTNGVIIGRYGSDGEDEAAMDKKLSEVFGQ